MRCWGVNWRHSPPRNTYQYFAFYSLRQLLCSLFIRTASFAPFVFPLSPWILWSLSSSRCRLPPRGMRGILCVRGNRTFMTVGSKGVLLTASLLLAGLPALSFGQTPPPPKKLPAGPPAPQSTHYPIFILAFGNNPNWSVESARKAPNGWIVLGIRLFHSNPPKLPMRPPTPGSITPRTPRLERP